MQNSQISFTSNICFLPRHVFNYKVGGIPEKNIVKAPWTYKGIVKERFSLNRGAEDCVAGGITDGKDVVMFHFCKDEKTNTIQNIENALLEKIDLNSPYLQGLVLGSKQMFQNAVKLFDGVCEFMENHNIPYSKFKGHKHFGKTDLAYSAVKDTWYLNNNAIDLTDLNNTNVEKRVLEVFDEFSLCKEDEFVFKDF